MAFDAPWPSSCSCTVRPSSLYKVTEVVWPLKSYFNGPPDNHVLIKQRGNNAILTGVNPMPQQFYPSSNDSVFAMGRRTFVKTKGEPNGINNSDNKIAGTVRASIGSTFNQIPPHKRTGLVGKPISFPQDSSQRIERLKNNAIGGGSMKVGLATSAPLSFKSNDTTSRNDALRRCRAGGCVAPKKKGANNSFKSGGGSIYGSIGNRQINAP